MIKIVFSNKIINRANHYSKSFLLGLLGCSIFGCSLIIPQSTQRKIYVLGSTTEGQCLLERGLLERGLEQPLIIKQKASVPLYDTTKIWFRNGHELGYYQLAEWSESVSERLGRLLKDKLRCDGFEVANGGKLYLDILEFVHQAETRPGELRLRVRLSFNSMLEKDFEFKTEIDTYDVLGVVEAADILVATFLSEISLYLKINQHRL